MLELAVMLKSLQCQRTGLAVIPQATLGMQGEKTKTIDFDLKHESANHVGGRSRECRANDAAGFYWRNTTRAWRHTILPLLPPRAMEALAKTKRNPRRR